MRMLAVGGLPATATVRLMLAGPPAVSATVSRAREGPVTAGGPPRRCGDGEPRLVGPGALEDVVDDLAGSTSAIAEGPLVRRDSRRPSRRRGVEARGLGGGRRARTDGECSLRGGRRVRD